MMHKAKRKITKKLQGGKVARVVKVKTIDMPFPAYSSEPPSATGPIHRKAAFLNRISSNRLVSEASKAVPNALERVERVVSLKDLPIKSTRKIVPLNTIDMSLPQDGSLRTEARKKIDLMLRDTDPSPTPTDDYSMTQTRTFVKLPKFDHDEASMLSEFAGWAETATPELLEERLERLKEANETKRSAVPPKVASQSSTR